MSNARYTDWYASPNVTARMIAGFFDAIDKGLAEEGIPLTDEQRAFLMRAVEGTAA